MSFRLRNIATFFALGVLGCHNVPGKTPDSKLSPSGSPPKSAPEESHDPSELPMPRGQKVSFEKELREVSAFRKLSVSGTVLGLSVDVHELIAHVERAVDLETPERALKGTEAMLVGLGVVPFDFDYRATMLNLLRGQLAGLYEPRLKAMLIRADLEGVERRMTLLHELVHALQDQHFDLEEVVSWTPDDTDRSSALSCLAEGDATSAMFDGVLPEGQSAISLPEGMIAEKMRQQAAQTDKEDIPALIQESLRAPYLDGINFVDALRRRGGWEEVNRVWKRPPITTEQVLHLDKYDSAEAPLAVAIPSPPPDGRQWTMLLSDIWGEQSSRLIFEQWQERALAARSAAGWGGDRIVVYQHSDTMAVAWTLLADTEKDAEEMYQSFSAALGHGQKPSKTEDKNSNSACGPLGPAALPLAVARQDRTVVVTTAPFDRKHAQVGTCREAKAWVLHLMDGGSSRPPSEEPLRSSSAGALAP